MKSVITKLSKELEDPTYRIGWVANIAMAQIDCERWYRERHDKVGKSLNKKDRYTIANEGAEYFIKQLTQKQD
tara:strand:+ start:98 stop:316 length:219 start_codon:yes stop_codon:yes gene_type:complete